MEKQYNLQLKKVCLKATPQRLALLHTFADECHPQDAETICKKLRKQKIDRATIYRTLILLSKKGLLRATLSRLGATNYELANDHHHHHMICTDCGDIETIEDCALERALPKLQKNLKKFTTIQNHAIELFGICKSCAPIKK